MGVKEAAVSLYLRQLREDGIPAREYYKLTHMEQFMLEKKENDCYYLKEKYRKLFKVVMTGGVFDVIHIGHVVTLGEAKKHGDVLIVVVAQDEHIAKKNRQPLHNQGYRSALVQALKPVDLAILGGEDFVATLNRVKPDAIAYGYDQKILLRPRGVEIIQLKSKINPQQVKTTEILKKIGI
ncbi:MAG: adenylyltransferase/cytidyltransferase family protein [Candidatus Bilamarchaeaceae archaeon]